RGLRFTVAREPKGRIASTVIARFEKRVRELTGRSRGVSLARMVEDLSRYLRGWGGYFGFCQTPFVLEVLDRWLRRRLRSVLWTQWRHGRTRFAELRRRGVGRAAARKLAGSAHRPWRLANTPALGIGLPNAYFDSLRLSPFVLL